MKLNQFVVRQDHLLGAITVERRTAVEMGHEDTTMEDADAPA
jgi:hypothetical protein